MFTLEESTLLVRMLRALGWLGWMILALMFGGAVFFAIRHI
jgi:hypothetical protein